MMRDRSERRDRYAFSGKMDRRGLLSREVPTVRRHVPAALQ